MLSKKHRFSWLILVFALQIIYFPLNQTIEGGYMPRIPWDDYIPFWPIWALPYQLSFIGWAICYFWAAIKMDARLYRTFIVSTICMLLTSYAVYLLFPTYVERPNAEGSGWQYALFRSIYANDRVNNAFPSGHTYNTMLILFFWWDWRPKLRWWFSIIAIIIILSTLFAGQHNLVDLVGGIIWAWASYHIGHWWIDKRDINEESA